MLCARNGQMQRTRTRLGALLIGFAGVLGTNTAYAQADPIAPGEAIADYLLVDQWVRKGQVPRSEDLVASSRKLAAVSVTLRINGRVIGRGSAGSLIPNQSLLSIAARAAIGDARGSLPEKDEPGWEQARQEARASMVLSVELSGELVEIPSSELQAPGFGLTPGSEGIGLRQGDQIEVMSIEEMLVHAFEPEQAVRALAVRLTGDGSIALEPLDEILDMGFRIYRFEQTSLGQPGVGKGAVFFDRGGRIIDAGEINTREIERFAEGLSKHIQGLRWGGVEQYGLMGSFDPVSGRHATPMGEPFDQAIGALALLRYGSIGQDESHIQAREVGRELLIHLAAVEPGEQAISKNVLASCVCVGALAELGDGAMENTEQLLALRDRVIGAVEHSYTEASGFDQSIPKGARGLVAWALVRGAQMDPRIEHDDAIGAVRSVFRSTPAGQLVGQMPFLGWAELEAAGEGDIPAAAVLDEMRAQVYEHMLRPRDLEWKDRDLQGGIVFTASGQPLPSWHGLRPMSFVATMLGDARLTRGTAVSGVVPKEISELVQAIRFVRQLAATDPVTHMYTRPERAKWGIRSSLWDQQMSIESSAMGLMMMTEMLRSMEQISMRGRAPQNSD